MSPAAYRNLTVTFTVGGVEQTYHVDVWQADATMLPKWEEW